MKKWFIYVSEALFVRSRRSRGLTIAFCGLLIFGALAQNWNQIIKTTVVDRRTPEINLESKTADIVHGAGTASTADLGLTALSAGTVVQTSLIDSTEAGVLNLSESSQINSAAADCPTISRTITKRLNVPCVSGTNGQITFAATGGVSPYTYTFNGSSNTTGEFTGLSGGEYRLLITDANGCTKTSIEKIEAVTNFTQLNNAGVTTDYTADSVSQTLTYLVNPTPARKPNGDSLAMYSQGNLNAMSKFIPIGFKFKFDNFNYDSLTISEDGIVSFNRLINLTNTSLNQWSANEFYTGQGTYSTPIVGDCQCDTAYLNNPLPFIAAFRDDMQTNSTGAVSSKISYQLSGTAPNRKFTVEWRQMQWHRVCNVQRDNSATIQLSLYETTNVVELGYKAEPNLRNNNCGGDFMGDFSNVLGYGYTIGLFGRGLGPGNYISYNPYETANRFSNTTVSSRNFYFPTGRLFRFTPPTPPAACNLLATTTATTTCSTGSNGTITLTASGGISSGGNYYFSKDGGATYTLSTSNNGQFTFENLAPGTYSIYVHDSQHPATWSFTSQTVTVPGVVFTAVGTNPTTAGGTNGSIALNGLTPNTLYSVNYTKNGTPAAGANLTSNGTGTITISGLTQGNYTNIIVGLGGCNSAAATVTLSEPPGITTQPRSKYVCVGGGSASFAVVATNATSYQWQVSTNGGAQYNNITNGGVYSNVTTSTLSISNTTGLNSYMYRCVVTNTIGSTNSNAATLTAFSCGPCDIPQFEGGSSVILSTNSSGSANAFQSFVPSCTGNVTNIHLSLASSLTLISTTLSLNVYNSSGVFIGSGSPVLTGVEASGPLDFSFNVPVVSGQTYYFGFSVAAGSNAAISAILEGSAANPYASGGISSTIGGTVSSNDAVFLINITATPPEINLKGNGITINNGETAYSNNDHRDFGAVSVSSGTIDRTFTIENTGSGALSLSANNPRVTLTGHTSDFTVTTQPAAASIASNGSLTFVVTFNPTASGTRTAVVSIANDDSNENPYTFNIQGTGDATCSQVATATEAMTWTGSVSTDWANPCNWTPNGIPTATNAVTIPAVTNDPIIVSGSMVAKHIQITGSGASLTVNNGAGLTVSSTDGGLTLASNGLLTNRGTINATNSNTNFVSTYALGLNSNTTFDNYGTLNVTSSQNTGLEVGNGSTVHNYTGGLISIAARGGIRGEGPLMNDAGATISISGTNSAIQYNGSVSNSGLIEVTGQIEANSGAQINNNACGTIKLTADYFNGLLATTINNGLILIGGTLHSPSGGTFTNNAVLKYGALNVSSILTNSGNASIVVNNTPTPIFTYGGTYNGTGSSTVNGIFTNSTATASAGTFTAPNTFVPDVSLPAGSQTLYAKITPSGGACFYVVPFTYIVNINPTITAATAVTRQQSNAGLLATIATVNDAETPAGSLTVTATTVPANITVTGITNVSGTVTATVAANCFAAIGANTVVLTVTDANGGTATANFTVNVTANTAPTLTYNNAFFSPGAGGTILPASGPSDNGEVYVFLQSVSPSPSPATITVNNITGAVTVPNTIPVGIYTITVVATDACTTDTAVPIMLSVQSADYSITTAGGNVVITDITGTGETLEVSQSGNNIRFNVTGKTYSIDGGATTPFTTPADIALAGKTGITINAGNGNDVINVATFSSTLPSLTINGGTGDDQVFMNGDIVFTVNANLDLDLQNDDATPGVDAVTFAANANLNLSGTGAATVKVSKNVTFNTGSTLITVNGNLTVEANQQSSPTSGNFIGVLITGTSTQLQTTPNGTLTVKGRGGDDASGNQQGVKLAAGGKILGGEVANAVTVVGTGGVSGGSSNYGVWLTDANSSIFSLGGPVSVTGTGGGSGTSGGNVGVRVTNSGEITSAGGNVTVVGQGGLTATGNSNSGISVQASGKITSNDTGGNVTITGTGGGSGASGLNSGIYLAGGELSAGGSGTVDITGQGGGGTDISNNGLSLEGLVTSKGGNITLTGKPGGGTTLTYGLYMSKQTSAPVSSILTNVHGGNISIITNSLRIVDFPEIRTNAAGSVTIKPFTAGREISISNGLDAVTDPLMLSDLELDRVSTGTLIIGDANSGNVTVSQTVTRPASTNVQLVSGGDILLSGDVLISGGGFNTGGGTLLLDPGTSPAAVKPIFNGTDVTASTLSFAGDLSIAINGATAGDGTGSTYSQLKVAASVNLTGVALLFEGAYVPVAGNTFTIIDNDGSDAVTGTFNGLAQGANLPNFLNSSLNATISYTGGDGNDVVLTVACPAFAAPTASVTLQPTCTTPTGTIVITAPTGADIQYSVGGAYQASATFATLSPNTYSVTAKNTTTGCISSPLSLTVNTVPNAPAVPTASVKAQPTCTTPTGTIVITAPTGADIQYSIGGAYQASATFSGLAANTYSVTAKNTTTGCISSPLSLTVNAVPNAPATPTASVTAQPTCLVNTGTIVVTAPTGADIQYSIGGTYQASATFATLSPDTYSVTAKNTTTGCISSPLSLTVNAIPTAPAVPTASVTSQPTCTTPTGTIVITAPTGADIQYSVGGAYQASATFSGLAANTYSVTAKNTTTGCVSSPLSLTVNVVPNAPAVPTASVTTQPTCTTPTGTLVITAPTGADIQYSIGGAYQASATFSGLAANTYSVTAKNTTTGCVSSPLSLTVNTVPGNPATPTASVTSQPTCLVNTGTIVVTTPTGADIQYSIGGAYQASATFSGLAANTYSVTAKNTTTGCISSPLSLTVNAVPNAPAVPTASVTVQPTCTTPTGTIVITAPTGGTIEYSVGGAYQASATFSGLAANTYSVTAKNTTTSCISSPLSLTVNAVPNAPAVPTASVTAQPTCTTPTGTIVITAPTGADIQYSIGGAYQSSATFAILSPNTYSVTAKNTTAGCISSPLSLTVNVVPNAPAVPTASVTTQPTCTTPTGTIVITAPTGADIQYSIGGAYQASATFSGLAANTYSVTAKNTATGCISSPLSLIVNVVPNAPAVPTASVTAQPTCTTPTGTIVITAPTGADIQYSIGGAYQASATFSGLAANTYSVTAKNTATGCVSSPLSLTVNAVPNAPAVPTASVTAQPTCTTPTGTIVITAPTGADIQYSVGGAYQASATFSGLAANTYSVTAKNTATGCISSPLSLTVNVVPTAPSVPTASVTAQPTCTTPTGTIVITAPTGADIQYSIGGAYQASATFATLSPNTYSVTAKNTATGCISSPLSLTVNAVPTRSATFSYAGSPYTNTGTAMVNFTGTTGGVYSSTTGLLLNASTGEINLTASTPGTYTVTYTLAVTIGCPEVQSTASVQITALTQIIYVNASNVNPTQDGSTWTKAYASLPAALSAAALQSHSVQVWVAQGTYQPGILRKDVFSIPSGVEVYGGFSGTETQLDERNWNTHKTILSGEIGTSSLSDNVNHVVIFSQTNAATRLDGFTVERGFADFVSPTQSTELTEPSILSSGGGIVAINKSQGLITHCVITNNKAIAGGGILLTDSSRMSVTESIIHGNEATFGGGVYVSGGSISDLVNVLIVTNKGLGGGLYINRSLPQIINSTIASNQGTNGTAGGIFNTNSSGTVKNSIVWGNSSPQSTPGIVMSYSLVQGGFAGTGNISQDPLFVNASPSGLAPSVSLGDYHVQVCSPAINAGDNTGAPTKDLEGNARPYPAGTPIVDMGAYESQSTGGGGPATLTVNEPIVEGTVLKSGGKITAVNRVSGGVVEYRGGESVTLLPGFSASGAVFQAVIGGCNIASPTSVQGINPK